MKVKHLKGYIITTIPNIRYLPVIQIITEIRYSEKIKTLTQTIFKIYELCFVRKPNFKLKHNLY